MRTMFASKTKKRKKLFFSFFRNTVYKFYLKLVKTNIIEKTFIKYKNIYVKEVNSIIKYLYMDTSFINNKNGSELVNYNPLYYGQSPPYGQSFYIIYY